MTCSRSHREFGLEPAFWAVMAALSRLRQGSSSNSRVCTEGWRGTMVKEVRVQGAGEKRSQEVSQRKMLQKHNFKTNGQA